MRTPEEIQEQAYNLAGWLVAGGIKPDFVRIYVTKDELAGLIRKRDSRQVYPGSGVIGKWEPKFFGIALTTETVELQDQCLTLRQG